MGTWTDDRVKLLKKLHKNGLSMSLIAERIGGVSRNAVIGKLARLGLTSKRGMGPVRQPREHKRGSGGGWMGQSSAKRRKDNAVSLRVVRVPVGPLIDSDVSVTMDGAFERYVEPDKRKGILEIERGECRWPHGDPRDAGFHFCGQMAVVGQPWCEHHCQRAFAAPRIARKRPLVFRGHPGTQIITSPLQRNPRETEDVS